MDKVADYRCTCVNGYTGKNCEIGNCNLVFQILYAYTYMLYIIYYIIYIYTFVLILYYIIYIFIYILYIYIIISQVNVHE